VDLLTALEHNPELASDAARKVRRGLEALRQSSTFVKFAIGRYTRAVRVVQQLVRRIFARNIAMRQRALHEWGKRQEQEWSSSGTSGAIRRPPSDAVRERVIREEFAEQRRRHAAVWRLWRKMQLSLQSQLREVTTELHGAFERTSFSPIALKHLQDRMAFLHHRLQHHDTAQPRYHGLEVDLVALDARVVVVMRKEATERVVSAMDTIGVHTEDAAFMDTVVRRYEEVLEAEHARKRMQRHPNNSLHGSTAGGGRRRTLHATGVAQHGAAGIAAMTRKKSHSIISAQRVLTQPAAQVMALSSIVSGGVSAGGTTFGEGGLHRLSSSTSMSSLTTKVSNSALTPHAHGGGGGGLQRRASRSRLIRFDSADMLPAESSFLPTSVTMEPTEALIVAPAVASAPRTTKLDMTLRLSIVAPEYPEHNNDLGLSILTPKDRRKFRTSSLGEEISPDSKQRGTTRTGVGLRQATTPDANSSADVVSSDHHEPHPPPKLSIAARQCFTALGISLESLAFPVEAPGTNKFSEFVHAARVTSGFPEPASAPPAHQPFTQQSAPRYRTSPRTLVIKELPHCPPRQPHSDKGPNIRHPRTNRSAALRQKPPLMTLHRTTAISLQDVVTHEIADGAACNPPAVPQPCTARTASPPRKVKTDTNLEGCRDGYRQRHRRQNPPPRPPIDLPPPIPLEWFARPPSPPFGLIDEALAADFKDDGSAKNVVTIAALPDGHTTDGPTALAEAVNAPPPTQPAATVGVVSIMTDGTVRLNGLDPKAYLAKHCHSSLAFPSRGSSAASALSLMPVATLPTLSRVVNAIHMIDASLPPSSHSQSLLDKTPQTMIAVACSDGSLRVYSLRSDMQETMLFSDCPTSRQPFTAIETCGSAYLSVSCEDNIVYTYAYGEANHHTVQQQQPPQSSSSQHTLQSQQGSNGASALRAVTMMMSPPTSTAASNSAPSRHASPQLTRRVSHVTNAGSRMRPGSATSYSWAPWGKLTQPTTITHMVAVTPAVSASHSAAHNIAPSARCLLAVATYDHSILVWDINEGSILTKLDDHTQGVHYMFMSRSTNHLVSCSYDSTVRLWDVLGCFDDLTASMASSHNHDHLHVKSAAVGFHRVSGGLSSEPSVAQADGFASAASSPMLPKGRRPHFQHTVRSLDSDPSTFDGEGDMPFPGSPTVMSDDARSGGGVYASTVFTQHRQAVLHAVDVSGKDRLIASISQDNTIQMWDQLTLEPHFVIADVPGHLFIGCVAFPAVSLLAYVFADNTLRVFSSSSGKLQSEAKLQHPPKAVVKLSHQGLMGVGSTSGHVRVFNAEAGSFVTTADKLHNLSVTCMTAVGPRVPDTTPSTASSSPQHLSLLVTGGEDRCVHMSRIPTIRQPGERAQSAIAVQY
jgi:WD40 repeat protein